MPHILHTLSCDPLCRKLAGKTGKAKQALLALKTEGESEQSAAIQVRKGANEETRDESRGGAEEMASVANVV